MTKPKRPKTQAERLADLAKRRAEAGLKRRTFWLSEEQRAAIARRVPHHGSADKVVGVAVLVLDELESRPPLVLSDAKTGVLRKPAAAVQDVVAWGATGGLISDATGRAIGGWGGVTGPSGKAGSGGPRTNEDGAVSGGKHLEKPVEAEQTSGQARAAGKSSKPPSAPSGGKLRMPKADVGSRLKKDAKR